MFLQLGGIIMIERKIKNNFLSALIIAGIAYVIGLIASKVLIGIQQVLFGVATTLISLITLPLSIVFSVVAFVVAAVVYFVVIEKMKLNVGLVIGTAFIQAIVRTIISFVLGLLYGLFGPMLGYSEGLGKLYSFATFAASIVVLFVASFILVSMSMKNAAVNPVQMARPVQPYPVQQPRPVQPYPAQQSQMGETVVLGQPAQPVQQVQQPQMGETVVLSQPAQQPQTEQPVESTQQAKPAFCPNCGQKVIEGNQFCIYCGNAYTNN